MEVVQESEQTSFNSTDCDTETVPESEVSTSINASSVTVSDDEGVTVLDNDQSLEGDTNLSLEVLTSQLKLPNQQWVIQQQTESVAICNISVLSGPSSLVINDCIVIKSDYSWILYVHRNQLDRAKCPALSNIPEKLSSQSLQVLVTSLEKFNVCPGHPDKHFVEMGIYKNGKFMSKDGKKVAAKVDNYSNVILNGKQYDVTVRSANCELVVQGSKCASCIMYRDSLRRMHHQF